MARLTELSGRATRSIPAAQQFRAVAYLRWCLFRNGFRRKGGKGELAARIAVFPIAALFVIGPMAAAFSTAYAAGKEGNLGWLLPIFWVIFALQIVVSINIAPPGLSFDPESLIRFPVTFSRFLVIRLFLGLLSASTIIGTLALLAAALGVSIAVPSLTVIAFAAALTLALCNMLFIRMVFAWVDRWLSTRRAREFFTFFIIAFSIGIQYLNVTFNGFGRHTTHREQRAKIDAAVRFYHHVQPYLAALPPGFAASSILNTRNGATSLAAANILGILLAAAVFLAIFAWRMQREYRGENLSEVNHAATPTAPKDRAPSISPSPHAMSGSATASVAVRTTTFLSPKILTALHKEWIYVRRNPSQFYGLLLPLAMVFLFAARNATFGRTGYVFPAAVAYSLLGIAALSYNAFGLDGPGVQFYFLAPIPIRTIFLAKNLFSFLINIVQLILVYLLLVFTTGAPPLLIALDTICWAVFAAVVNVTFGNMRSITAPKKLDPSKMSRKQASQLSGLISLGIMLVIGGLGYGLLVLANLFTLPWLPILILLILDFGALALYAASLSRLDVMVLNHRETLLEELTKVSA